MSNKPGRLLSSKLKPFKQDVGKYISGIIAIYNSGLLHYLQYRRSKEFILKIKE